MKKNFTKIALLFSVVSILLISCKKGNDDIKVDLKITSIKTIDTPDSGELKGVSEDKFTISSSSEITVTTSNIILKPLGPPVFSEVVSKVNSNVYVLSVVRVKGPITYSISIKNKNGESITHAFVQK